MRTERVTIIYGYLLQGGLAATLTELAGGLKKLTRRTKERDLVMNYIRDAVNLIQKQLEPEKKKEFWRVSDCHL